LDIWSGQIPPTEVGFGLGWVRVFAQASIEGNFFGLVFIDVGLLLIEIGFESVRFGPYKCGFGKDGRGLFQ
jgi:hypothetical protein